MKQPLTLPQHDASDPKQSVWVSASAGTGKTSVLVNRILRFLLRGVRPERILCITFTKAAAAEIVQRIQEIVLDWSVIDSVLLGDQLRMVLDRLSDKNETAIARRLLPSILQTPGGMRIMTIHAFCQSVLSRFPLEAQINPGFRVIDEIESLNILYQAKQTMLQAGKMNSPDLIAALDYLYGHIDEDSQNTLTRNLLLKRYRLHQFFTGLGNDLMAIKKHFYARFGLDLHMSIEKAKSDFIAAIPREDMARAASAMQQSTAKTLRERADALQSWLHNPQPDAGLYIRLFVTAEGGVYKTLFPGLKNPPEFMAHLFEREVARIQDFLTLKAALTVVESSFALAAVAFSILSHYNEIKEKNNVLDYEDQIILTARLLTELSTSEWVLYKLDGGIDHILVDEAQDTSPAQWDIVDKLAEEFFSGTGRAEPDERTIFIVGDEKQSIFSFQNADPAEFARMRRALADRARQGGATWDDIALIENFRSSQLILDYADTVFNANALVPYLSQTTSEVKHIASHADKPGMIEIWPLVLQSEKEDAGYTDQPDFILARNIADYIEKLLTDKTILSTGKTIEPGDIMILVRKRHPMVTPITKALKERNIAIAGADRLVLKDQLAAQDCLAAIQVGLNPYDDYNLACFLKSPFIGMAEEELLSYSHNRSGTLWERLRENDAVTAYCRKLASWGQLNTPSEMIQLLANTPCPSSAVSGRLAMIQRLGFEADDIINELLEAAKNFESLHPPSNREFLTWILSSEATMRKQGGERDAGRVRIMTVHAAKGLQAPIVILADPHSKPGAYLSNRDVLWESDSANGFLWATKSGHSHPDFQRGLQDFITAGFGEYYRLLYVAITRAKERLIICGSQAKRETHRDFISWYDAMVHAAAVMPDAASYARTTQTRFGRDVSIIAFAGKPQDSHLTITPSIPRPALPPALRLIPPNEASYARPLRPSQPIGYEPPIISPLSEQNTHAYKRGQIIHAILAMASEYSGDARADVIRRVLERESSLADDEKEAIACEVKRIMDDAVFGYLFTPQARAEVPVIGEVLIDGKAFAVSGQIDRLLVTDDRVVILDYKTNRPPATRAEDVPEVYRQQLRSYKLLIEKIYPGKTVETVLLWTALPLLMPIDV